MKRTTIISSVLALILSAGLPALAQHGGGKGPGGPPSTPGGPSSNPSADRSKGNSDTRGASSSSNSGQKTPGELLTQNTKLASKLQGLLPPKTDLQTAASGFKNLGAFVSAVMMAYVLALFIGFVQAKTVLSGAGIGLWAWVGFVAAPKLSNYLFSGWSRDLYLINNGYHLVSLLVMGAMLAVWT